MIPETTHQDEYADTRPRKGTRMPTRWLAYASLGGSGCFTICVLALHVLESNFNPLVNAMSDYAHGAQGWLTTLALFALGLGSLALTFGLARTLPGRSARIGQGCLAIFGVCGLVAANFPDDLPGHWNAPSLSGSLHASAAQIATIVISIAAFLLAWSVRRDPHWHRSARLLLTLALAMLVGFVLLELSFLPVLISAHPPILFGLLERIFFVAAIAWLAVAAIGLLQTIDDTTVSVREMGSNR
jgi:hypothetical membrane protein